MPPSTHEESIFYAALQLGDGNARAAYLRDACGGNSQLQQRVERLISAYGGGDFLERPGGGFVATALHAPVCEQTGATIGAYKLLEQIGEGGMGLVFLAEQTRPLRRRVALKIIKPGLDTRSVVARFEAERQALALMDHPNIARVYDAGATESGRPYFVMELVRGAPITDYCRERNINLAERLELYIDVCQAVQHAHQKGIIHRDLKPTNILVSQTDTAPVPKVIDFGVAKATTQPLTERTLFTQFSQIIGTPLYMSPEQADLGNQDVDTRSDVYSLGVVLYELLTGTTPFDADRLRRVSHDEMRRIIREEEPPKPSTRATTAAVALSTLAAKPGTLPVADVSALKGDLDWIVMKALDKDRRRRYESASALAADLRRYLDDEPIEARPPSAAYRVRKFTRRNKAALATGGVGVCLLLLLLGIVGWTVFDRRTRHAAVEAQVLLSLSEASNFYDENQVAQAVAAVKRAESLAATDEANLELTGRVRQWQKDLAMVARLEDILRGPNRYIDADGVARDYNNAFTEFGRDLSSGDTQEIEVRIRQSKIKKHLVIAIDDWACVASGAEQARLFALNRRIDQDAWRNELRDAWEADDLPTLLRLARSNECLKQAFGTVLLLTGGLTISGEGSEVRLEVLDKFYHAHPDDYGINLLLGNSLIVTEPDEAAAKLRYALKLGPGQAGLHDLLSRALNNMGKHAEAEKELREALRLEPGGTMFFQNMGYTLACLKRHAEAETYYEKLIAEHSEDPKSTWWHSDLADVLSAQEKFEEALPHRREALRHKPDSANFARKLFVTLLRVGQGEEAEELRQKTVELDPDFFGKPRQVAELFIKSGQFDIAADQYKKAFSKNPVDSGAGARAALLYLLDDDRPAYESICRQLLTSPEVAKDSEFARHTAWVCLATPQIVGDLEQLVALADFALAPTPTACLPARERGLAAYRAGDWEGTLRWCAASRRRANIQCYHGENMLLEAMALHRLGQVGEARAVYRAALSCAPGSRFDEATGRFVRVDSSWLDGAYWRLLLADAAELGLKGDRAAEK